MGTSKHLASINGEPLIYRTIRLLRTVPGEDSEIIVTSHNAEYEFDGCARYEPKDNRYEIDRFTEELICDDMCFLYGDTYYTEDAIRAVMKTGTSNTLFFGTKKVIVAVKIGDSGEFRLHKHWVRQKYVNGEIAECKGWQVYQSVTGQDLSGSPEIRERFVFIDDETADVNTPEDYETLVRRLEK